MEMQQKRSVEFDVKFGENWKTISIDGIIILAWNMKFVRS